MKNIVVLGSTGSIGTQALDVVRFNKELKIIGLSAYSNFELLAKQANEFRPSFVVIVDEKYYENLKNLIKYKCNIFCGEKALIELSKMREADVILNSIVGIAGLKPTISALNADKTLALANKESLVAAGEFIKKQMTKGKIIPVDSEHSAIFQCIHSSLNNKIKRIILTASGGPFRNYTKQMLENVTVEDALKHPTWKMGKKITVDSATLMNKGFEVIEAYWLFDVGIENIEVIIHPQSIIHSMVEFEDKAILAQLGVPDMRVPIQYAMTFPKRFKTMAESINFENLNLTFEKPDFNKFKCLKMAYDVLKMGFSYPIVLNAANEVCVNMFINGDIKFNDISRLISLSLDKHKPVKINNVDEIFEVDKNTRNFIYNTVVE